MLKRSGAAVAVLLALAVLALAGCGDGPDAPLSSGGIPDEVVPTRTPTPAWMERATPVNALNIFEEAAVPSGSLFEETDEFEIVSDPYDGVDLVVKAQPGCGGEERRVRAWAPDVSQALLAAACALAPIPDSDYRLVQDYAECAGSHPVLWELTDAREVQGGVGSYLIGTDPADFRVAMLIGLDDEGRQRKADFVNAMCNPGPRLSASRVVSEWVRCLEADADLLSRVRELLAVDLDGGDPRRGIIESAGPEEVGTVALARYDVLEPVLTSHLAKCSGADGEYDVGSGF